MARATAQPAKPRPARNSSSRSPPTMMLPACHATQIPSTPSAMLRNNCFREAGARAFMAFSWLPTIPSADSAHFTLADLARPKALGIRAFLQRRSAEVLFFGKERNEPRRYNHGQLQQAHKYKVRKVGLPPIRSKPPLQEDY